MNRIGPIRRAYRGLNQSHALSGSRRAELGARPAERDTCVNDSRHDGEKERENIEQKKIEINEKQREGDKIRFSRRADAYER